MSSSLDLAHAWLEAQAEPFGLPGVCPIGEAEKGAWLIRPFQQAWEGGIVILLCSAVFVYCLHHFRAQLKSLRMNPHVPPASTIAKIGDPIMALVLLVSLLTVVYHKIHGNKVIYLLQPCHVMHLSSLIILSRPRGSASGAILFAVYCHLMVGPLLGMVGADLSCYTQRFEALNWGVQHGMLLLFPLWIMATRRFQIYRGRHIFGASFTAMSLFHYAVLTPMSVITGTNLNYMLCPPAGTPLALFGRWYRVPTLLFCAVMALLMRYVVLAAFLRAIGTKDQRTPEQMAEDARAMASAKPKALKTLGQIAPSSSPSAAAFTDDAAPTQPKEGLAQRKPTAVFQPRDK